MKIKSKKLLTSAQTTKIISILKSRFDKHKIRHTDLAWSDIQSHLESYPEKLWSLYQMEETGGEPDVLDRDKNTGAFIFYDCSSESPKGRRSICYDREAQDARKEHKPIDNALDMAAELGVELLSEDDYRFLQKFGPFDTKTSSWIETPSDIRKLGGALFADFRYGHVFIYHNGAQSYYAARGFRAMLRV